MAFFPTYAHHAGLPAGRGNPKVDRPTTPAEFDIGTHRHVVSLPQSNVLNASEQGHISSGGLRFKERMVVRAGKIRCAPVFRPCSIKEMSSTIICC
jgi:hypothetical protein